MSKQIFPRKGLAIVVVLLIVLSLTSVALVSLQTTKTDQRMTMAFQDNRQAAQAAHQAGIYILDTSGGNGSLGGDSLDPLQLIAEANNKSITTALGIMENATHEGASSAAMEQAWQARMSIAKWYTTLSKFSGLYSDLDTTVTYDSPELLKGDLSRSVKQVASIGSPVMNQKQIDGFSDGDAYCSFTMHADSYALIGRSVPLRGSGSNRYYLLADLNARISGFKREMGLINAEPMPCNQ